MNKIFIIEDNPADIRLTKEAFESSGFSGISFEEAMDGEIAIEKLKKIKSGELEMPDLVFLDLNLPRKDGREVLTYIKSDSFLKKIPVIVLTTSNAEQDIKICYDLHANCFVNKPVDFDDFFDLIKEISSFWFKFVKLPSKI